MKRTTKTTESMDDYISRRIETLEKELTNAKNNVRRIQIQISQMKQRQRNRKENLQHRIAELFTTSSLIEKSQ